MELVKQFNSELSSLYESKPPISKAKMTSITRTAIKAIKLYKHVVQSVEKFIQKCKPEYKVPGLYVIDSIVRQSRHQFGTEKDVFAPRFARNLQQTFIHLFNCPPEDKSKVIRVLNLWQKNAVFESEVIQPLFDLADPNHPVHKEQPAQPPSNGITPVKPPSTSVSAKKEGGTAGWVNQLHSESAKPLATGQVVDVNILQQLQQLQNLLLDQQTDKPISQTKEDQVKFDKKLLDFDYGEEEEEDGTPAQHHSHSQQQQQQQQVVAGLDSIGSILANPEVLRQLQTLQHTLSSQQGRQQQLEIEEKMRKMQEMRQQEEEFDKHLAQTVPNLPFADECELKPGGELAGFPGMDLSQPPPGYLPQQKMMVPPGMMLKPPPSPLEDGEHASSDADERIGRPSDDGGPSVVVLDSDSPADSPAHGRRRRRRSRSHSRSRRRSRSRSRNKRRRSSSYDEKDWEKVKQREAEKERERERKRRGLPPFKKNHLAVCSTTLWIGHLSKLVQQEELSDTFGKFGDIVSIDLIPPRGCAFICMNRRQDAFRALQELKHHKMQGKTITLAWAPGKGMKGKEYKDYWEVEQGVSYIPWSKVTPDTDLEVLEEGGMIDEESFPEWLKEKQKKSKDDDQNRSQTSSQAEEDDLSKGAELDIPVPAPTLPGYIPLPDGPQPNDIKVSQPPPNMPPLMAGPLGMMPPFGLPNVPRLLGPMGMAMGPGLMPNVPLGVPPPGMQGLMGNPLMHQQMLSRMPQPVGSPFNPPPGVGILGGHPQLSQIPLPGGQDKSKSGLPPLGVPPPSDPTGLPPSFTDSMMQIPFTLPPQLQMPGLGMLTRSHLSDKGIDEKGENKDKLSSSPSRNDPMAVIRSQFGHPPPLFSPSSMMKIPPPMAVHSLNKSDITDEDKDDRETRDKDYRESLKDYKDRDKDRERDRDYRNKRDRDYRGDRDYRDRFDKDYRERDKDYRDKDRDRKDRRDRDKDDKSDQDFKDKEGKMDEKDRKDDSSKDDKNYRDRSRNRDRDRDRDRDRGRDRSSKWGDRDRERGRDRDDKRGRDRERDTSKEIKGRDDRDKGSNLQDRLRNMAQDQDRDGDFTRGGMDSDNFQGPGGRRNDNFHHDGFPPDMHGRHPGNRREGFDNRGQRDLFDLRGPPPDGFDPRGPPPRGSIDNFGPRGPPPDGFGSRGPPPDGFGPRGPPPDGFGPIGPPPDGFGPRGPPPDAFGPRGPPSDGFGSRGPHPDRYDPRGPPPGVFGCPDNFDMRGPPPDFEGTTPDNFRGPPPDGFNRGHPCDNFGPGGPPGDNFMRGPPDDEFGHPPFEGFGGPSGEFQPRIRIEFFARGRGRGGLQENFRGRSSRGGLMFSPRGGGLRGPRPGVWMEGEGPSSGFSFPPRGFGPSDGPERFTSPGFDENVRGRGGQIRGRGKGNSSWSDERRKEEEETGVPSPKRLSRWSNPSPPPPFIQPDNEEKTIEEILPQTQKNEINETKHDSSLLQQDSYKTITCGNETSEVDTENSTDKSLPQINDNLQEVDQSQTEFSNLFERPCTTPLTSTADEHTSSDLAIITESNTGIENCMSDVHMPEVSGNSMVKEEQFSGNDQDAHRKKTLESEGSDVGLGIGHFENSSQLNFELDSARLDEKGPGDSFINQESATLSTRPHDEDRPMFDELSLENKLDLSVLSQSEDFLPSVASDSDQDFNSRLISPSEGQTHDNNSFLEQELADQHERQNVSSENNCMDFESELNDPAFTVEDGNSCGESTNVSEPALHEQSVEEDM